MKLNKTVKSEPIYTYEGGKASKCSVLEQLKRATMSCLLWENEFYEDGVSIADRISNLVNECIKHNKLKEVIELINKVKFDMKLRHCPLWMINSVFKSGETVSKEVIASVLTRPDDMGELLAMYNKDKKSPLANQLKKGIALAFEKFDEYQLAKYNRNTQYKLVDIANLCHPNKTEAIDKLIKDELKTPETWEVLYSQAGSDTSKKRDAWHQLIQKNKLPAMACLKNIRNMLDCGMSKKEVVDVINNINNQKLLPIDFIRAGQSNPTLENEIEQKFFSVFNKEKIGGKTALLVDVSGSMYNWDWDGLTKKSSRESYAHALSMIAREIYKDITIYSFSDNLKVVPNRRGFSLATAINDSQSHSGTDMWGSIELVANENYDRIIVITDEQTYGTPLKAPNDKSYIIDVASYNNGVGYDYGYKHIYGFSDKVFDYITEIESETNK